MEESAVLPEEPAVVPDVAGIPSVAEDAAPAPFLTFTQAERDWLLLLAYLHLEQRKPELACVLLRLLHRAFPIDAEVQRCLALGEMMAGHPLEASRAATRALGRAEPRLRVPVGLVFARALWDLGKHDAARDFITNLLIRPQH
jgi:hypothetical protein